MLRELKIKNLILMECAHLYFEEGFHAFTGETGAGKTAILKALELICGARMDAQLIRSGCEKASVEALFDLKDKERVYNILENAGLEIDFSEELLIKREISSTQKSRLFINHELAQLSILKKIVPHLLEIVSQHAATSLNSIHMHQKLLDHFAENEVLCLKTQEIFFHLKQLKRDLSQHYEKETLNRALKQQIEQNLDEIEQASITSSTEDDELFNEYATLSRVQELKESLSSIYDLLQEQDPSIIALLSKEAHKLEKIDIMMPSFNAIQKELQDVCEHLTDLSYSILSCKDSLQDDPTKAQQIDERLKLLKEVCKKHGPSLQDVLEKKEKLLLSLSRLEDSDSLKIRLTKEIEETEEKLQESALELSKTRAHAKPLLEKKLELIFSKLNLPQAKLHVHLLPTALNQNGKESVEFFLSANVGEKPIPLKDRASGGELSRVLLALKILMNELQGAPTLFFDEIDANLGGETALKMGQFLREMSHKKQVICITHHPQVAALAKHHYSICKNTQDERTYSHASKLSEKMRLKEIERMLGGKKMSEKASELAKDLVKASKS